MKKYTLFWIVVLLGANFLFMGKASADEEDAHNHMMNDTKDMPGMEHMNHDESHHEGHTAHVDPFGGPYRSPGADCGGLILCPASSPHGGYHASLGDWNIMTHGLINFTYTVQPSPRGESGFAAPNHFMVMGDHPWYGGNIRFTLGASLDALTESEWGKPQILQTGELYRGMENVDVQHRHKLITNLSATYVHPLSFFANETNAADWFCSAALVGDVSGVPMEYHRASARRFTDVSLFHHGTTDKHITSSVLSCGADIDKIRIAVSTFHGQEPTANPYSIDLGTPNSFAVSFQYLPTKNWALSLYYANIKNAERGEPGDIKRVTAAAMYTLPLNNDDWWSTTLAITHDEKMFESTNMLVLDSTVKRGRNYFYGRIDAGQKPASLLGVNSFGRDGLTTREEDGAENEKSFLVGAGTIGYARTLWQNKNTEVGVGADITGYTLPSEVKQVYGSFPVSANMYFFVNF